jgi:5-methylcytosine-specific restriction endonuclease McrA
MKKTHNYTKLELVTAIQQSRSLSQVLIYLNIPVHGSNYRILKKRIRQWNIDISHFTGQSWAKNMSLPSKIDINDYLLGIRYINTHALKLRLIKERIFEHKCCNCGLTKWNNQSIPIELHHIDGNRLNNNLHNLQILCPNCHAQTNNYCSKNIKDKNLKKGKKQNFCNCGSEILPKSLQCYTCYRNSQSKNIPTKEELILELQKHKTMLSIAKFYNVSDNTIRKWCHKYIIDYKSLLV